ncbi:MAG: nucleotide sugar dehydrogenase [Bacteroidota bacterium]
MYNALAKKEAKLAVVGLGYVGLPIALEFARHFSVVGFDINAQRVGMMQRQEDPSGELEAGHFTDKDIHFSFQPTALDEARFFVVAVPTPIDQFNQPNLNALRGATTSVAKALKKGDYVVFESTVYPGCTEEVCVPILEKHSGLKFNVDFKVGYSPERINPGDKKNTIDKIVKIVSGSDEESLKNIAQVYRTIITAGVHEAPSMKVAEAAKIVENTQRDVNIALMNELSQIFDKIGINTYEVLEAAGTKWNCLNFYPGLVGGHCIGVDPYYLIQKAIRVGHNPILISAGRSVNDGMPNRAARRLAAALRQNGVDPRQAKVLMMGVTFKENVTDIRNSKAGELAQELMASCGQVDVVDPLADAREVKAEYGFQLCEQMGSQYDAVVMAVSHEEYQSMNEADLLAISKEKAVFFDIKGIQRGKINTLSYLSL